MSQPESDHLYPSLDTIVPFLPQANGEGMVLLAVDESSIGRMLMRVFSKAGMGVLWARGLGDSLGWLDEYRSTIGLAFLDCHQTEEEALEFCRQARAIIPGLPIVQAGGIEARADTDDLEPGRALMNISKPYLPTELVWDLRGLLRTPRGRRVGGVCR